MSLILMGCQSMHGLPVHGRSVFYSHFSLKNFYRESQFMRPGRCCGNLYYLWGASYHLLVNFFSNIIFFFFHKPVLFIYDMRNTWDTGSLSLGSGLTHPCSTDVDMEPFSTSVNEVLS